METTNVSSRGSSDFINKLPDPILHHILGLLNTEEAVQICVLSKRWGYLWTFLSSLNFNFNDFGHDDDDDLGRADAGRFAKFVNTLLLRLEPLDLDVFLLFCEGLILFDYSKDERDWICYAVEHNPRVLHLSLSQSVPPCIYKCTSLEELYLHDNTYYQHIDNHEIDSSVQIVNPPNLRKLTIYQSGLHSNYVKNLLTGCQILEFLQLDSCFLIDCVIAHKSLKHLAIVGCHFDETQLVISAPNLLSFLYDDSFWPPPSNTTLNMPSLASSCLMSCNYSMMKCLEMMTTFLSLLTNVERLELHFRCHWLKESTAVLLKLPIFSNLKYLTVAFCMCSCFQMVNCVLKSSSNLEKLTMLQLKAQCSHGKKGANKNESTNASSTIAVSPCKKLEIVELKYWRYNKMVHRLLHSLMVDTEEFKDLKINLSKYENSEQYLIREDY